VGAITLNTTAITDVATNPANVSLTGHLPATTGILVDTTAPAILSVVAPANGTYRTGQNVDFTVTFSEAVNVTGSPGISLTVGAAAKSAAYFSGTGTTTWVFRYTPAQPDIDADGIAVTSPLLL